VSVEALKSAITKLAAGENLSEAESSSAFDALMSGVAPPSQIAALLMGLRVKGETAQEVAGAAAALRRAMLPLHSDQRDALVDTCGTGGGRLLTFNISTAAALLAAGTGVRIAKHGNRSFTSRSGSADVLEALGVALEGSTARMESALRDAGIVFMFAPAMHPAMRHVGPVRREIAIPTIMNILGPLANPAGVRRQVIGVADPARLPLIGGALAALGTLHALVVHGEPGMDEISPLGRTRVLEIRGDKTNAWDLHPDRFGIAGAHPEHLVGGSPEENAALILSVLSGKGAPGAEAAVLLNAAAAVYVSGAGLSFDESYAQVRIALADGAGLKALDRLRLAQGRNASAPHTA
jgi:anthranilate phosphoribosyltransferase